MSELSLLSLLNNNSFKAILLECREKILLEKGEGDLKKYSVNFSGEEIALLHTDAEESISKELANELAPLVFLHTEAGLWEYSIDLMTWLWGAKQLVPEVTDWIGIYYKASHFLGKDTTNLYLGPYFGESTDHEIIPLEEGLCGLALREERVVNVANVHEDERHIACSLKTNSELIIPLKNSEGVMVAELDIDCNRLNAFTPEIESKFKEYAKTFKAPERTL